MKYQEHRASEDMAWQMLLDHRIQALPVKVSKICHGCGLQIHSYRAGEGFLRTLGLAHRCAKGDGFTVLHQEKRYIFYSSDATPERCRFILAHELGHYLLGHVMQRVGDCRITGCSRDPSPVDDPQERAAHLFAARLLAPACVLWGCRVESAAEIARLCQITLQSAEFRMEQMSELYIREAEAQRRGRPSPFLSSPQERALYRSFVPYIRRVLEAKET